MTSMDEKQLREMGSSSGIEDYVVEKSGLAIDTGCAGVVCSAKEAAAVRKKFGDRLKIVTPGIRPMGLCQDDQARVSGVADAIAAGADHVVVGRAIRNANNPRNVLAKLLAETSKS